MTRSPDLSSGLGPSEGQGPAKTEPSGGGARPLGPRSTSSLPSPLEVMQTGQRGQVTDPRSHSK